MITRTRFGWAAVLLSLQTVPALADQTASVQAPSGRVTMQMEGRMGAWPIGLAVTLRDDRRIEAVHYFYASHGVNIPLTGDVAGEQVTLTEPGGGVFRLHLTNPHSDGPGPLGFYTATGLAGTWTGGGKVWPVTLTFENSYPGDFPVPRYRDVTPASDADFESLVRRFLDGVTHGNRAQAAGAVSYPLRVNGRHPMLLRNRAAFLAAWDRLFTPAVVAQLRGAIPHEMFVRNGQAMVLSGLVWFDARGAVALNLPG